MKPQRKQENRSIGGLMPPQAVELEQAVLGAVMLEKDALIEILDIIGPDSFYQDQHKVVYESILSLYNNSKPIDLLTVTTELKRDEKLEIAGGAFYVTELTSNVASSANIQVHARIIAEMHMKRELIRISSQIQRDSFDDSADVFEILAEFENSLNGITGSINSGTVKSAASMLYDTAERIKLAAKSPNGLTGIPTLLPEIDKITGGWKGGTLIIIAARPAMAKSDLAINFGLSAAKAGFPTALFSLEMPEEQVMDRVSAITGQIERDKISSGNFTDEDWKKFTLMDSKTLSNFYVVDEPSLSTYAIRAKCRRLKNKHNIKMIIIDYLQLVTSHVKGNRNEQITEISRSLKVLAMELGVPVIALSQLSRAVETRGGDKRPMLSDLRDSGAIEQDADIVAFPFRPSYYGITQREDGTDCSQLMELHFAKHRAGKVGTVDLRYLGAFGKVSDYIQEQDFATKYPVPETQNQQTRDYETAFRSGPTKEF